MAAATGENGPAEIPRGNPIEVFLVFLKLGLTAFGGPIAHLGFFQREIVQRREWILESALVRRCVVPFLDFSAFVPLNFRHFALLG